MPAPRPIGREPQNPPTRCLRSAATSQLLNLLTAMVTPSSEDSATSTPDPVDPEPHLSPEEEHEQSSILPQLMEVELPAPHPAPISWQRHVNPPEPNDPTNPGSILHSALCLPNTFPWVADFLFHDGGRELHLPRLVCGIQKASASLIDLIVGDVSPSLAEDESYHGVTSFATTTRQLQTTETFCLIPLMSRDHITLGIQVGKSSDEECNSQPMFGNWGFGPYARFAFDNNNTAFLSVGSEKGCTNSVQLSFASHDARSGRLFTCFTFKHKRLCDFKLGEENVISPLDSLTRCNALNEDRKKCLYCVQTTPSTCDCLHQTHRPTHPLDFSIFARNAAIYAGTFPATVRNWNRSQNEELEVSCYPKRVSSRISVSVNHESVSELCDLAVAEVESNVGAAEEATRRAGSAEELFLSQYRPMDSKDKNGFFEQQEEQERPETPSIRRDQQPGSSLDIQQDPQAGISSLDSGYMRKIKNREAAARSNLRRKENLQNLKASLKEAKDREKVLVAEERRLRIENGTLRNLLSKR